MHGQQRHAWFVIMVVCGTSLLIGVSCLSLWLATGNPQVTQAGFAFGALFALLGFGKHVVMDERDQFIRMRALNIPWGVTWLYFGLLLMGPWFYVAFGKGVAATKIPLVQVTWFPLLYMAAFVVNQLAFAMAILGLYGKDSLADE